MYLNGDRLREAARLQKLTMKQLQKKSGLPENRITYYWNNKVTVTNQEEIDALGKALNVTPEVLLLEGEPDSVAMPDDKFSWDEGDIDWK